MSIREIVNILTCAGIEENEANIEEGVFKLHTFVKDDKYIIEISDNGCGMSEEKMAKIFEPYYTTKATGTGLGLTTVYKIIKEFSGEINVKSEEKKGTSFTIMLPVPQLNKKLLSYRENEYKDS